MAQHVQPPLLAVLEGQSMSADDAAWASIADAADRALMLPGLSPDSRHDLLEVRAGALIAAGLPSESHRLLGDVQRPA